MSAGVKTLVAITVGTSAVTVGASQDCVSIIFSTLPANANTVYIGDVNVTNGRYAVALTNGTSYTFNAFANSSRPGFTNLNLNKFYVYGGAVGQVVYVGYVERGG